MSRQWTEEEINIIKENWEIFDDKYIHEKLMPNRTWRSIKWKREQLGLYKLDPNITYSYDNFLDCCEEKGYIPISKREEYKTTNTKMKYLCPKHIDKGILETTTNHLMSGRGCYYCGREKTEAARRNIYPESFYKEITEKHGFIFVRTIIKNQRKVIEFICPKHKDKGIQVAEVSNLKKDNTYKNGCKYCAGVVNKTDEDFKKEMFLLDKNIIINSIYTRQTDAVNCTCKKHNISFNILPSNLLQGQTGCEYCIKEKRSLSKLKTNIQFEEQVHILNPHIDVIKYNGMQDFCDFYCKEHNIYFSMHPSSLLRRKTGCRQCSGYSAENKVECLLIDMSITYELQKRFLDCVDKRPLPFDFYLPDYNIAIETDGQQHYMAINFGGITDEVAEKNLEITKKHDKIKNEYCKRNNILLIRIPYWEFGNIEVYLKDELRVKNKIA